MSPTPAPAARYAIIGHPVEHSKSPQIHAAYAQQTGVSLSYIKRLAPLDDFVGTVQAFAAEPGAHGCNVTVPFKEAAFRLAARHTPRCALAGAANTLRFDAEGWLADNTDGFGLVHDITVLAQQPLAGRRVLVIGAGGAAAGALGPLLAAEPSALHLANRSAHKAHQLLERHAAAGAIPATVRVQASDLDHIPGSYDVIINASASSLAAVSPSPVSADVIAPGALVLDMMYGPASKPFLAWAQAHGGVPRDGLGMLVSQAAASFECWTGLCPDPSPVLAALRRSMVQA